MSPLFIVMDKKEPYLNGNQIYKTTKSSINNSLKKSSKKYKNTIPFHGLSQTKKIIKNNTSIHFLNTTKLPYTF